MVDVYSLKNYIINNPELIEVILEKAGFHNIKYYKHRQEYRCAREEGRNPTSVRVKTDTLSATCFSTNVKGDIITLVQNKLFMDFPTTIKRIVSWVGFEGEEKIQEYELPFDGFYKKIKRLKTIEPYDIKTYPESILDQYLNMPNKLFLEDGIPVDVQKRFKIGYDSVTNRITIPWYSTNGIVGVMGRLNKRELDDHEIKYYPLYAFPKSNVIYGYVENYNNILNEGIILISESEKSTMRLAGMGINVGVSLGGCFISEIQANLIKSMFSKTILVLLDEGLDEEHSREIAEKLKMNGIFKNHVGYVYDRNNLFLPKDSKLAPADLDKKTLKQLINHCTIWL